jgi:predicted transcriptional regulator
MKPGRLARRRAVREIERSVGMGRGAVQRELENLVDAGLVMRRKQGNHVYFQANPKSAIF